ncbi:TPA: acylphosphatase [Candidatus Geothermarchaeota archaeon]|nr:acylphosphatase [Candidatus Geothermarchaeota archaeon]
MTLVRAYIRVYGRVQGVFYRANTRNKARELGLKGYVRNMSDGSVEAVVEGDKDKVEKLLEWMRIGPPMAKVDRVIVEYQEYKGDFKDFTIKY